MSDMGKRRRRRLGPEERRLWERVAATASPLRPDPPTDPARPGAPRLDDRSTAVMPPAASDAPNDAAARADRPARPSREPGSPFPARPEPRRPHARPPSSPAARVSFAPPEAEPVGRPQPGLDRRTAERLRKGARRPDARIDLHGMTAERAHRACLRFLADAAAHGHRVVLVITGKGRRAGDGHEFGHVSGRGVLRDSLPGWLRASPLGHSIVGIYQAHRRHGGEGAFYVYLKRHR